MKTVRTALYTHSEMAMKLAHRKVTDCAEGLDLAQILLQTLSFDRINLRISSEQFQAKVTLGRLATLFGTNSCWHKVGLYHSQNLLPVQPLCPAAEMLDVFHCSAVPSNHTQGHRQLFEHDPDERCLKPPD